MFLLDYYGKLKDIFIYTDFAKKPVVPHAQKL